MEVVNGLADLHGVVAVRGSRDDLVAQRGVRRMVGRLLGHLGQDRPYKGVDVVVRHRLPVEVDDGHLQVPHVLLCFEQNCPVQRHYRKDKDDKNQHWCARDYGCVSPITISEHDRTCYHLTCFEPHLDDVGPDLAHTPVPKADRVVVLVQVPLVGTSAVLSAAVAAMEPAVKLAMVMSTAILSPGFPVGGEDVGGLGRNWAGQIATGFRHGASLLFLRGVGRHVAEGCQVTVSIRMRSLL